MWLIHDMYMGYTCHIHDIYMSSEFMDGAFCCLSIWVLRSGVVPFGQRALDRPQQNPELAGVLSPGCLPLAMCLCHYAMTCYDMIWYEMTWYVILYVMVYDKLHVTYDLGWYVNECVNMPSIWYNGWYKYNWDTCESWLSRFVINH